MTRPKKIATCDCETDPFEHGFNIKPFLWGFWDGRDYQEFDDTPSFVEHVSSMDIILYAHNGGKFDFMFLLKYLKQTRAQIINGRFVSLKLGYCELRDSYAIIPEPLKNFGAKKEIEYWKLAAGVRDQHWAEIKEYLYTDCTVLYDAVKQYRDRAGKLKTIASNALSFSKKLGIDPGKTNHRFDEQYRKFYYGGRTECFQPGTHSNIKIIDIHSAYPYAMSHDHATGNEFRVKSNFDGMEEEDIKRAFISLECFSNGAFPKRTNSVLGLCFPRAFDEYHVTGWEYLAALELGLLSDIRIRSVHYTAARINFSRYVEYWYAYKRDHPKDKFIVDYTIGKIMMNSLYGKLAQNPARYKDYRVVLAGTRTVPIVPVEIELKNGRKKTVKMLCEFEPGDEFGYCKRCGEKANEHGWILGPEFEGHEIHERESLWKWKHELGVEWKGKNLYKNVATGASVTGFTRAHLLRAMASIGRHNVIYCDTDGIICGATANLDGLPFNDELGAWELEESGAPLGHFCGKKLYGIELSKPKKGNKYKIASKGARLEFKDMERIAAGETIQWKSPAPTFHIDGSFDYLVRNIKSTANAAKEAPIG